mgnify:FL=1
MKKFVVFLLSILIITPAFAEIITTRPYNRYSNSYLPRNTISTRNSARQYNNFRNNYNGYQNTYNRLDNSNLSALEQYALRRNYNRQNDITRLERLEELAFGSVQEGDINSRYENVEKAILARPQMTYNNGSILDKISNFFIGNPTGFTPSITPNSFYNRNSAFYPAYNNGYAESYSNGIFGRGYHQFGNDYGYGTGVRILD